MLKELFLGLTVILSILLFFEIIGLIRYVAILGTVLGAIELVTLIPVKKTEVK